MSLSEPVERAWGEPLAHVERDFARFETVDIHLALRNQDGTLYVLGADGLYRQQDPHIAPAQDGAGPALRLNDGLARALLDALAAHYGGSIDVQTSRKDLLHERGRVDKLIAMIGAVATGIRAER